MIKLDKLKLNDCYYLDGYKIYNQSKGEYEKEVAKYRYMLKDKNGDLKSLTMKWIYRELFDKNFCIDEIQPLEGETFRELVGSDGMYYVSNYGRIKSMVSNEAIIMKTHVTPKGYERLQLVINGRKVNKLIHQLVAKVWLDSPKDLDQEIHHIDFNKRNNKSNNLMYVDKEVHYNLHKERRKQIATQTNGDSSEPKSSNGE